MVVKELRDNILVLGGIEWTYLDEGERETGRGRKGHCSYGLDSNQELVKIKGSIWDLVYDDNEGVLRALENVYLHMTIWTEALVTIDMSNGSVHFKSLKTPGKLGRYVFNYALLLGYSQLL